MCNDIESRFRKFMSQLPFAQDIDGLALPVEFDKDMRADYFLEEEKVVIELKSLQEDPSYKVDSEIDKHRTRDDYPLVYGPQELSKILKHLEDGKEIREQIYYKISRSIEGAFRKANKQIGSTKRILNCPKASGLLVILNEGIEIFSPETMANRVSQLLMAKDENGSYRYDQIASVWIIIECFFMPSDSGTTLQPSLIVDGPTFDERRGLADCYHNLQSAWALFNGMPLVSGNVKRISDDAFKSVKRLQV